MTKFIQVTHSDDAGKLTCRLDQLKDTLDEEFDCIGFVGSSVIFTVVEMTDEEYENLPEFTGW